MTAREVNTFYTEDGRPVYISACNGLLAPTDGHSVPDAVLDTFRHICLGKTETHNAGPSAKPGRVHKRVVKILSEHKHEFCMHPLLFTQKFDRLVPPVFAKEIVRQIAFGTSLLNTFSDAGLFAYLDRLRLPTNRLYSRAWLEMLLASICMSISGIDDANDIPVEAFKCWLSNFRTTDGFRWRDDLWGSNRDVFFQCLREVVLAFARISHTPGLARWSGQVRVQSNGTSTWRYFRDRAQGVDREWLAFYDEWVSETRVGRNDSRAMLRAICAWSRTNFPSSSVPEVMVRKERPQSLSEHIKLERDNSRNISNIIRLAERFSSYVSDQLRSAGIQEALWPLVSTSELGRAQEQDRKLGARKPKESRSVPLAPYLQPIVEEILAEGENGWPGTCSLFYEYYPDKKGVPQRLFSPVLPTFFKVMMILPLRGVQLIRFDSGEGDRKVFDGSSLTWRDNKG